MFYKHSRLLKELRENGRAAPAEIVGMRTEGSYSEMRAAWADDSDLTTGGTLCRLELRVMPPGELGRGSTRSSTPATRSTSCMTRATTTRWRSTTRPTPSA